MLSPVADDVYSLAVPFRFAFIEVGGRMSVIRLPDGGLWVHSPVRLTPEVRAAVDALGPVRFLVAPNLLHHLFIQDWAAAWPEARVAAPVGLRRKRPDLRIDLELGDTPPAEWAGVVDLVPAAGIPKLGEVAFFHRPSRTVLLTDLAFNIHQTPSWLLGAYLRLGGSWRRLASTLELRAMVKDRAALRASVRRMLEWDAERVLVCHGDIVERDGREALRGAFAWL